MTYEPGNTGFDDFKEILSDVIFLWKWIAGAAVVPFLAHLASFSPPWPDAIPYLTAIFEFLAIMVSYQYFKGSSKKIVTRAIIRSSVIFLAIILVYMFLLSEFTFRIPSGDSRAKGFVCTEVGSTVFTGKCPWLDDNDLKISEWDAQRIWTSWSITIVRVSMAAMWLCAFAALSSTIASFVIYQKGTFNLRNKRKGAAGAERSIKAPD